MLLRGLHRFAPNRRPYNISNMPGEERWRVLDVEPTRAFGHKLKKAPPPPPPPSRTKWTRRVPHPVLIGHAASLTPY